jgi:hypothetical protein
MMSNVGSGASLVADHLSDSRYRALNQFLPLHVKASCAPPALEQRGLLRRMLNAMMTRGELDPHGAPFRPNMRTSIEGASGGAS